MRLNFGAKPWSYPQPVMIIGSYDENEKADAMNAAWAGISGETEICMCLSAEHVTTQNILNKKAFTVSIGTEDTVRICDFVGIRSAAKYDDKLERAGLHPFKSQFIDAPLFEEFLMTLECVLISYDPETCHLFGQIVNINADNSILTNGKPDPDKLKPIFFDPVNATYCSMGTKIARAFTCGNKIEEVSGFEQK